MSKVEKNKLWSYKVIQEENLLYTVILVRESQLLKHSNAIAVGEFYTEFLNNRLAEHREQSEQDPQLEKQSEKESEPCRPSLHLKIEERS